ncbi:MAG: HNH endonuclease [Chitinophagaceae bacterium]|nr:HNH endonuclease [Chitinophagaceae bacterium]
MPTMPKATRAPWMPPPRKAWTHAKRWAKYNTHAWRDARLAFLVACKYQCATNGCSNPATSVDHVKPISSGHDGWDQSNWQPLCTACHRNKSSKEGGHAAAGRTAGPEGRGVKST